jgi:hypothetical protein
MAIQPMRNTLGWTILNVSDRFHMRLVDIHDPRNEWRVGIGSDKEHGNECAEYQRPSSAVQKRKRTR